MNQNAASDYQGPEPKRIEQMFGTIAKKYDLANSVLSVGIHHVWRHMLVRILRLRGDEKILDCATGTGDLAFALSERLGDSGQVVGLDFCAEMLEIARTKSREKKSGITFTEGDVLNLPFTERKFDLVTIAFGIRNVADPRRGIEEMARVTKLGGRVTILEFSNPKSKGFAQLYKWYSMRVLPRIGGLVTGQRSAYEYLQTSSAQFPAGQKFVDLMMETGKFSAVKMRPLSGGIATIYTGTVI